MGSCITEPGSGWVGVCACQSSKPVKITIAITIKSGAGRLYDRSHIGVHVGAVRNHTWGVWRSRGIFCFSVYFLLLFLALQIFRFCYFLTWSEVNLANSKWHKRNCTMGYRYLQQEVGGGAGTRKLNSWRFVTFCGHRYQSDQTGIDLTVHCRENALDNSVVHLN